MRDYHDQRVAYISISVFCSIQEFFECSKFKEDFVFEIFPLIDIKGDIVYANICAAQA